MKKTREFSDRVQSTLNLPTRKEAEFIIQAVIGALEQTLIDRIDSDGFSLKLGSLGKFKIHHRPSIYRKIPFTGEMKVINRSARSSLSLWEACAPWRKSPKASVKRKLAILSVRTATPWSRNNHRNIKSLIRLAWFCVSDHGFTRFSDLN